MLIYAEEGTFMLSMRVFLERASGKFWRDPILIHEHMFTCIHSLVYTNLN